MFFLSCRTDFVSILFFFLCIFANFYRICTFCLFFDFFWSLEFVFSNSAFVINVCFSESLVIKYAFKTVRECDYKMIPFWLRLYSLQVRNLAFILWLSLLKCGHQPLNPEEWLASNFSLHCHPWIKCKGHENVGINSQSKKLLIVKQILFISNMKCKEESTENMNIDIGQLRVIVFRHNRSYLDK